MRKTIRFVLALILCAFMAVSLAACQDSNEPAYEPESAVALWEKIDQTMSTLESMEMTRTTKMVYYDMGYRFEYDGSTYVLTSKDAHYTESKDVITCGDLTLEQTLQTVEAYCNGKMYYAKNDGTYDQKLCSEMTHEEYDQTQTGEVMDQLEIADCTNAEFSKAENDSWSLNFSSYTKKAIDKVLETLGLTDDIFGASIEDMNVSIAADTDFYVQKVEIAFAFSTDAGEATPAFSVVTVYSGHNTAILDSGKLNDEEYTAVDDVRILVSVTEALQGRQEAASGKFALDIETSYELQGQTSNSEEKDIVTYGRKNGAYCYFITSEMDGQNFIIQYQNGEQTVTADGQTHIATQTEEEAKSFIDSLINSAKYSSLAVTNIQKQADGVYTLIIDDLDLTEYMADFESNDIKLTSGDQQITVTFSEGKLMQIESKITLNGNYADSPVTMVADSVVTFDDSATAA